MTLRSCCLSLVMCAAMVPVFAAAEGTVTQLPPATIVLDLDAAGSPSNPTCAASVPAATCPVLIRAATKWQYAPGIRDDVATAMRVNVTLTLQAVPRVGGYALRASRATVFEDKDPASEAAPSGVARQLTPPRYPYEELRRGKTGTVVLELWLEPGTNKPKVGNAWLDGKPARAKNAFVVAALSAAESWTFDPGAGMARSICVPVQFLVDRIVPPGDLSPCKPTYVDGYTPPKLLTKADEMSF